MTAFYIVAYGTLLDKTSLGKTIGQTSAREKGFIPVIIKGHQRLFNLRPDHYEPSLKFTQKPIEAAAANMEESPTHEFNGVAFEVNTKEFVALDNRERYYKPREVQLCSFHSGKPLGNGFTYGSDVDARWIMRDNDLLLPLWRDVVLARNGAYVIGEEFGKKYDSTTYMADGKTLLVDYYQDQIGQSISLAL